MGSRDAATIRQSITDVTPLGSNLPNTPPPPPAPTDATDTETGPVTHSNITTRIHRRNMSVLTYLTETPITPTLSMGMLYKAEKMDNTGQVTEAESSLSPAAADFIKKIHRYEQVDQGNGQVATHTTGLIYEYKNTIEDIFRKDLELSKEILKLPEFEQAIGGNYDAVDLIDNKISQCRDETLNQLNAFHRKQLQDLYNLFYPEAANGQRQLVELHDAQGNRLASPEQIRTFYQNAQSKLAEKQKEEHDLLNQLYNNRIDNFRKYIESAFYREIERAHHNKHFPHNPIPKIDVEGFNDFQDTWFSNRLQDFKKADNGIFVKEYSIPVSTGSFPFRVERNAIETLNVQAGEPPVCLGGNVEFPADTSQEEQLKVLKDLCQRMAAMGKGNNETNPFNLSQINLDPYLRNELIKSILAVNPQAHIIGPKVRPEWREEARQETAAQLRMGGKMMGQDAIQFDLNQQGLPEKPVFQTSNTTPAVANSNATTVTPISSPMLSAAARGHMTITPTAPAPTTPSRP